MFGLGGFAEARADLTLEIIQTGYDTLRRARVIWKPVNDPPPAPRLSAYGIFDPEGHRLPRELQYVPGFAVETGLMCESELNSFVKFGTELELTEYIKTLKAQMQRIAYFILFSRLNKVQHIFWVWSFLFLLFYYFLSSI